MSTILYLAIVVVILPPLAFLVCKWGAAGIYRAKDRYEQRKQINKNEPK